MPNPHQRAQFDSSCWKKNRKESATDRNPISSYTGMGSMWDEAISFQTHRAPPQNATHQPTDHPLLSSVVATTTTTTTTHSLRQSGKLFFLPNFPRPTRKLGLRVRTQASGGIQNNTTPVAGKVNKAGTKWRVLTFWRTLCQHYFVVNRRQQEHEIVSNCFRGKSCFL